MQVLWLSFYFPGPVAVGTPTQTSYSTHHMDGPTYFLQSGNWNSKCRLWYKKICCISLVVDWYMTGLSFWGQLLVGRVFECILVLVNGRHDAFDSPLFVSWQGFQCSGSFALIPSLAIYIKCCSLSGSIPITPANSIKSTHRQWAYSINCKTLDDMGYCCNMLLVGEQIHIARFHVQLLAFFSTGSKYCYLNRPTSRYCSKPKLLSQRKKAKKQL